VNNVDCFVTSFCGQCPSRFHIFAKWPVGQKHLDHAELMKTCL